MALRRSPKPELLQLLARSLAPLLTKQPAVDHSKAADGHTNGHVNRQTNGHANGHADRRTNGRADRQTNGHANGHANGHSNGHANGLSGSNVKESRKKHRNHADAAGDSADQVPHSLPIAYCGGPPCQLACPRSGQESEEGKGDMGSNLMLRETIHHGLLPMLPRAAFPWLLS